MSLPRRRRPKAMSMGCEPPALRAHDRFARRHVVLEPGERRPYDPVEWDDALVMVKRGEIDVESRAGGRIRFVAGDMLWFTGLPLRSLRNPGPETAVLVAVSRRTAE